MKNNISLIGMAGCGKSTIGVLLAKAKNLMFVDTDLLIQQSQNMFLHEILREKGIDGFIKIEENEILTLNCENTCIATGGSAVYSEKAMQHLKEISSVVYLDASFEVINTRIEDIKTRGVVIEDGTSLEDLYYKRRPYYEKYADIKVDANKSAEEVVWDILRELDK